MDDSRVFQEYFVKLRICFAVYERKLFCFSSESDPEFHEYFGICSLVEFTRFSINRALCKKIINYY